MQKAQTYTSPFGKAIYPHLSKCDVRFKPEGEYKVNLSLKDTQAQDLIKLVKKYQLFLSRVPLNSYIRFLRFSQITCIVIYC